MEDFRERIRSAIKLPPYSHLLNGSTHLAILEADVVFGQDVVTENEFLVFGRNLLKEIKRTNETRACKVLRIPIEQEGKELELLLALVTALKGKHDYVPFGQA